MSIVLLALNIIFLVTILIICWKKTVELKPLFFPAALIKTGMGILLGVIYSVYYSVGDTLAYVQDGNVISQLARDNFQAYLTFLFQSGSGDMLAGKLVFAEPRAIFLSKVVSVFSIITGGNYWMISVYFSLLSFFGCWYFVKQIHRLVPKATWPAVVAFLFFPSVVFWTSGVVKESLAIGSLAFIGGLLIRFWFASPIHWSSWIVALVAAWLSWNMKYYFAAIFFSVVLATVCYKLLWRQSKYSFTRQCFSWMVIFLVLLSISSMLHPNFSPVRFFRVVVENYQVYQNVSEPGDAMQFPWMEKPSVKILLNTPMALFAGLYRPFIWEATDNIFQAFVGVENLIIAVLSIIGLPSIRKAGINRESILVLAIIVYVIILCVLLTLSTPNFGTLSRYRTSYLPFFLLLLFSTPKINAALERTLNHLVLYKP